MKRILINISFIFLAFSMNGQTINDEGQYPQQTNNIGIGIGMSHLINDNLWVPGFHVHYGKLLGEKKRFSIGTGVELLLDDHRHSSIALAFGYGLTPALYIGYGPGIDFPLAKDAEKGVHLAHHFEIAYEFDLNFIHLGPVIEYGFSAENQHWMLGIHSGFSF